mmetsp:Transcript_24495/g.37266  ORF Transcript_24495/g.37266 Transcript_24495/m.37266 type:complete len:274 (-) Transcript_24495:345-1166(-)
MTNWNKIGDVAHYACIANSAIFAFSVVMLNESSSLFDDEWRIDGFCVFNKDVPFMNSHDLCLYFDTISAIAAGALYYSLKDISGMEPANELVKFNIFGIFAHGVGHGAISQKIRNGVAMSSSADVTETFANKSLLELVQHHGLLYFFWVFLLKSTMPKCSFGKVVPLAIVVAGIMALVPPQLAFTYVQTILLVAFSLDQLSRPDEEKDKTYALYALVGGCPVIAIAWLESTQCTNFIMNMGGHFVYDAYIPIAIISFYLHRWRECSSTKVKTT